MITVTVISQTIYVLVPDKTTRKFVKRHTWHICYIYHYTVRHNVIDSDICIYHKSYFIANTQRQYKLIYTCGCIANFNETRGIIFPHISTETRFPVIYQTQIHIQKYTFPRAYTFTTNILICKYHFLTVITSSAFSHLIHWRSNLIMMLWVKIRGT